MPRPDRDPSKAEVMPRPPRSHWPADDPLPPPAVPEPALLEDILELHHRTTTLHEHFLALQDRVLAHAADRAAHEQAREPDTETLFETVLDPATDTWLRDHRPTWTVPTLPLTAMADLLARAATARTDREVRTIDNLQVQRWLPITDPTRLRLRSTGRGTRVHAELSVWWEAADPALSRYAAVASATVGFEPPTPAARFPAPNDTLPRPCPYDSAELFHGPAFRYLTSWRLGPRGASGTLRADRGAVPRATLHHGLLDGALHIIPGTTLWHWDDTIDRHTIGFPHRMDHLALYDPLPDTGDIEVEARYRGRPEPHLATIDLQLHHQQRTSATLTVTLALLPADPLAATTGPRRRAYLRDRVPAPELLRSTTHNGATVLSRSALERADIPPGTVAVLYDLPPGMRPDHRLAHIAIKEHVARLAHVHPAQVEPADDLRTAHLVGQPSRRYHVDATLDDTTAVVRTREQSTGDHP